MMMLKKSMAALGGGAAAQPASRPKATNDKNIDSLFVVVMSFRRRSWIFTRPKFRMSYSTARLSDVDGDPSQKLIFHPRFDTIFAY
jgi:hypothetical protein